MENQDHQLAVGEQESLGLHTSNSTAIASNQQITPALFAPQTRETPSPPQEKTAGKEIQAHIISPSMTAQHTCFMPLPKGKLVILLQGSGITALKEESISLVYYHKNTEGGQSEEGTTFQKVIKPLLQEQEGGTYKLEIPLDFVSQLPELKQGDFIKINFLEQPTAQITYQPRATIATGSPEELTESKEELEKRLKNLWFTPEEAALLQAELPSLELKLHQQSGKSYALTTNVQEQLQQQVVAPLEENVEQLSKEEIPLQQKQLQEKRAVLEKVAYKLDYNAFPYQQLGENYEEADKEALLGAAYQQQVQEQQQFKDFLGQQILILQQQEQQLQASFQEKSIPAAIQEATAELENQKTATSRQFELLEGDINAIQVLPLNFADWTKSIAQLEQVPQTSKEAYIKTKEAFNQALQSYEQSEPALEQNQAYMAWKTQQIKANQEFEKGMVKNLKQFKEFVQAKKVPLAATGGDGKLEYRAGENKVSLAEQARFGDPVGAKIIFKSPQAPFKEKGISPEDVIQGGVGDCYLMAALLLLAEEDTKHLLEEMIVEQGDKYVVTLYSNDLPIQVEVDKQLLFLEYEDGFTTAVGAKVEKELWVAIIEKAYAKYQGSLPPLAEQLELGKAGDYDKKLPLNPADYGGDYTEIEGSQTSLAIEALVGNRLSSEQYIYLDKAGAVSEVETPRLFPVRVDLGESSSIGEEDLKDLLKASKEAGYKISVNSPEGMAGSKFLLKETTKPTFCLLFTLDLIHFLERQESNPWLFNLLPRNY